MPETGDWYDHDKKVAAIYKVLRHLASNADDAAKCVASDQEAARIFKEQGGVEVPAGTGARVVVFAEGEQALDHKTSVVLEVPPNDLANASDRQLKSYVMGNYPYWPTNS